jgi:hypothetical protein ELI_1765
MIESTQVLFLFVWFSILSLIDSFLLLEWCEKKKDGFRYVSILVLNSMLLSIFSIYSYPLIKSLFFPVDCLFLCYFIGKHKGKKLLKDFAFSIVLLISDWMIYQLMLGLTLAMQGLLHSNIMMSLVTMLPVKLFVLYIYMLFEKIIKKEVQHDTILPVLFQFVILPLFSLINVAVMQAFTAYYLQMELIFLIMLDLVFVVVLNVYFQYLLIQLEESYEIKKQSIQQEEHSRMQFQYYQRLEEKYKGSRQLLHDMKRHLQVLEEAEAQGIPIKNYMEDLRLLMKQYNHEIFSSHPIVNILLHDKKRKAEESDIHFTCQIGEVDLTFMKDMDITIILSNLLDNAIDACCEVSENRFVQITLDQVQKFIVIIVKNASKPYPAVTSSSKKEHEGLGIKNVCAVVEKYGGNIQIKTGEQEFCVHLYIPIV